MIATIDVKLYLSMKSKAAHAWNDVHVSIRISIRNPLSVETIGSDLIVQSVVT